MKLAGAYIHDEKYERLVALAEQNNRTLAGQCRHLFDRALSGELQVPSRGTRTERETEAAKLEGLMAPPGSEVAASDEVNIPLAALQQPGLPRRKAKGLRRKSKRQGLGGHAVATVADAAQTKGTAVKEGAP